MRGYKPTRVNVKPEGVDVGQGKTKNGLATKGKSQVGMKTKERRDDNKRSTSKGTTREKEG